jgi:glycosyltransferase involved in cell wall biosynthesis
MSEKFFISVLIATFNRPEALKLCLQGLLDQTDNNFEVLVADDGSGEETAQLIQTFAKNLKFNLNHIWQPNLGFRKEKVVNKAIAASIGEYLIFLDGDCLVQPDFVSSHRRLSQPSVMVTGSRVLLEKKLTRRLCDGGQWSYSDFRSQSYRNWLQGEINKILPLWIKLPDSRTRLYTKFVWRRIKGCNMSAWRQDVLNINGFDEEMVGWGHQDADFVFRLFRSKVNRKSGAWATEVFHLWHPSASRENAKTNKEIVKAKILAK